MLFACFSPASARAAPPASSFDLRVPAAAMAPRWPLTVYVGNAATAAWHPPWVESCAPPAATPTTGVKLDAAGRKAPERSALGAHASAGRKGCGT